MLVTCNWVNLKDYEMAIFKQLKWMATVNQQTPSINSVAASGMDAVIVIRKIKDVLVDIPHILTQKVHVWKWKPKNHDTVLFKFVPTSFCDFFFFSFISPKVYVWDHSIVLM